MTRHHAPARGEGENPWAGRGAVLLDIGGDIGALVVEMPPDMTGAEVEIRPAQADAAPDVHHPHVAVVARPVREGTVPSLVYPELVTGSYELYVKGTDEVRLSVDVAGGRVTEATWPTPGGDDGGPSEDPGAAA